MFGMRRIAGVKPNRWQRRRVIPFLFDMSGNVWELCFDQHWFQDEEINHAGSTRWDVDLQ